MDYYREITIDKDKVAANHTNFPVFVDITLNGNVLNANGYDVIFKDAIGASDLYFDLEHWDNSTKRWRGWVRVPSLSSSVDTVIRVYYGDSTVTTNQSSTTTWSEFSAVYFLSEPALGTNAIKDRTANANHMSDSGTELTAGVAGKLTYSIERSNDVTSVSRLVSTGNLTIPSGSYTVMGWGYKTQNTPLNGQYIWVAENGWIRLHSNSQTWRSYYPGPVGIQVSLGSPSNGAWHRFGFQHKAGQGLFGFLDGANVSTLGNSNPFIGINLPIALFQSNTASQPFIGRISHVFIANKILGNEWMETDFNNQDDPATFYSVGSEQAAVTGVLIKTGGSFIEKPLLLKSGGTFVPVNPTVL